MISNLETSICSGCGGYRSSISSSKEGAFLRKVPKRLPDIVTIDASPMFAISGRFLQIISTLDADLESVSIRIFDEDTFITEYFVIRPPRSLDLDLGESGILREGNCCVCGFAIVKKFPIPFGPWQKVPKMESWNGDYLFRSRNLFSDAVMCSTEFIEFARSTRLKGFFFRPLRLRVPEGRSVPLEAGQGIDYLAKNWPPEVLSWSH